MRPSFERWVAIRAKAEGEALVRDDVAWLVGCVESLLETIRANNAQVRHVAANFQKWPPEEVRHALVDHAVARPWDDSQEPET